MWAYRRVLRVSWTAMKTNKWVPGTGQDWQQFSAQKSNDGKETKVFRSCDET